MRTMCELLGLRPQAYRLQAGATSPGSGFTTKALRVDDVGIFYVEIPSLEHRPKMSTG